jgi:hypothetical protein
MLIRQTVKTSFKFIGFGCETKCPHCNNKIFDTYYIQQISHSVTLLPTTNQLYKAYKICSVCEHETEFGRLTGLFGSSNKRAELTKELDIGKVHTKVVYGKMNSTEKNDYLKLLNKLEQQSLVLYLNNY